MYLGVRKLIRPIQPPPRKNPQKRTRTPLVPSTERSRAAHKMSAAAARGELHIQQCQVCAKFCYPPRDACPHCLSIKLEFTAVSGHGELISETTIQTSTDSYFRERTPWRIGNIKLDAGPVMIVNLHADVGIRARVHVCAKLDKSGGTVLFAKSLNRTENMQDDLLLRELTATPKHRRILISDGRSTVGQAIAQQLSEAGASTIFVGIATNWLPFDGADTLACIPNVDIVPLDITDQSSVKELASEIGGKVDILINTADHVRAGGIMNQMPMAQLRDSYEVNVFGLQRLAQHFGPAMSSRGADGVNAAVAFCDILSVHALANWREYGTHSATAAARYSMLQCLRGEFRSAGVRVVGIFTGPIDDDWRQPLPPPKVSPQQVAKGVVTALLEGLEEYYVGDIAKDVLHRWLDDPKSLERELQQ
jgi:NAD(P)-dependent dehydrogenase (short-subunit alcohol dehydrogenase family)/uncharacterized OB-fold protein